MSNSKNVKDLVAGDVLADGLVVVDVNGDVEYDHLVVSFADGSYDVYAPFAAVAMA